MRSNIREQAAQGPAQQNNIISRVNWLGERSFVGVEVAEQARQECLGFGAIRGACFNAAIKLEQLGEQRQDERKGDLFDNTMWSASVTQQAETCERKTVDSGMASVPGPARAR